VFRLDSQCHIQRWALGKSLDHGGPDLPNQWINPLINS
jgi:hypothetical protein